MYYRLNSQNFDGTKLPAAPPVSSCCGGLGAAAATVDGSVTTTQRKVLTVCEGEASSAAVRYTADIACQLCFSLSSIEVHRFSVSILLLPSATQLLFETDTVQCARHHAAPGTLPFAADFMSSSHVYSHTFTSF